MRKFKRVPNMQNGIRFDTTQLTFLLENPSAATHYAFVPEFMDVICTNLE